MELIHSVLVERIKDRIADQMVDIPVPPVMKEIVAVVTRLVKLVPQGRVQQVDCRAFASASVQQRTVEHVPEPQLLKESVVRW